MSNYEEGSPTKTFGAVLAEVSGLPDSQDAGSSDLVNPLAGVSLPIGADCPPVLGGVANWDEAMSWIEPEEDFAEDAELELAPEEGLREAIALELGVDQATTIEQLDRARRDFMWRNHPDRLSGKRRVGATRRASIANNLLDEARRRLASRVGMGSSR